MNSTNERRRIGRMARHYVAHDEMQARFEREVALVRLKVMLYVACAVLVCVLLAAKALGWL